MRFLMTALCSTTLLAGTQAQAQTHVELALAETAKIERLISAAETARINGDCATWRVRLREAKESADTARENKWITEDGMRAYAARIDEARARPCPPVAASAPPPPAQAVTTPPPESILDAVDPAPAAKPVPVPIDQDPEFVRLSAAMEVAATRCNRQAWEAARSALIAAIEKRLETENDQQHRYRLNTFKNELRRRFYTRCKIDKERWERAIMLEFLYGPFYIKPVGIGVIREGAAGQAEEYYAGTTAERSEAFAVTGSLDVGKLRFGGGYLQALDKSDYASPAGTASGAGSGSVYGKLSPADSSGIFANLGLTGDTEIDFEIIWAEMMYIMWGEDEEDEDGPAFDGDGNLIIRGGVKYEFEWGDYRSSLSSSGTVSGTSYSFGQERDQQVRRQAFSAGLDIGARFDLSDSLALHLNARGNLQYIDYVFDSAEHNVASFGPPSTRDWWVHIRNEGDGFGFEGKAKAQLELKVSAGVSLTASVGADYWSKTVSPYNPVDGDEVFYDGGTTRAIFDDRTYVYGALGARFRF